MTHKEAIKTLKNGGSLVQLAEAIGVVASDPQSALEEIMLGLSYHGFVQEQAALALYRRTGEPLPRDRTRLRIESDDWKQKLFDNPNAPEEGNERSVDWVQAARAAYTGALIACRGNAREADEVAGRVATDLWEAMRRGNSSVAIGADDPDTLARFAYRLSKHVQLNERRRDQKRRKAEQSFADSPPEVIIDERSDSEFDEAYERLRTALSRLPSPDRDILVLHYLEGRSIHEVAQQLGLKYSSVIARLLRARDFLRELLRNTG